MVVAFQRCRGFFLHFWCPCFCSVFLFCALEASVFAWFRWWNKCVVFPPLAVTVFFHILQCVVLCWPLVVKPLPYYWNSFLLGTKKSLEDDMLLSLSDMFRLVSFLCAPGTINALQCYETFLSHKIYTGVIVDGMIWHSPILCLVQLDR